MKLSFRRITICVPLWFLRLLCRRMRYVRAAGGVVCDEAGNVLLIRRNGRADLPKGKVEAGESLAAAALREVEEETGIAADMAPSGLIVKTYHIYNLYGGWHLKQTSWFAMRCGGTCPQGIPQSEEGIECVQWCRPDAWREAMHGSYGTMREVCRKADAVLSN